MRTWPYEYRDEDDESLTIQPAGSGEEKAELFTDGKPWITPDQLPALAAALYEAAGKPAPVILERPANGTLIHGPNQWVKVAPSPAGHPSNVPGVMIEVANGIRLIGDEPLRVAIALIDAMHEAEDEPDPAEVQSLADEMHHQVARIGGSPPEEWRIAARTALRWMREREAAQ